jgi:tRNA (guanine37-N1)-methyltransferase
VCFEDESHFSGLLEYPHYTRPEVWHDMAVPPVLLSGHHKNIADWRFAQSLEVTKEKRPDLYDAYIDKI